MRQAAVQEPAAGRHIMLWRLHKNRSVAEAQLYLAKDGLRLHIVIDQELVIGCLFQFGNGAEQAGALARSARAELESRGWR